MPFPKELDVEKIEEKENEIREKYSFVKCGLEINKGWLNLVSNLLYSIDNYIKTNKIKSELEVIQIKQKYAELRVYTDNSDDYIENLISMFEKRSTVVCEFCGERGKIQELHNWYYVICDECKTNLEEEYQKWN